MNLHPGDIVLIRIHFHDAAGSKVRPAVVVLDSGDDDFVGAPITSRDRQAEFDFAIVDWQGAGLNVQSIARLHKIGVLSKTAILSPLKGLSQVDRDKFFEALCRAYCLKAQ
jgi:mRNA interferase MazF